MKHRDKRLNCARCLFAIGFGVKLVQRFTGLPETSLKRFRRDAGIPISGRGPLNWGKRRAAGCWMSEAWEAEWPKSQQYIAELGHWEYAYPLPSPGMVSYYKDVDASRERARLASFRRYHSLPHGHPERIRSGYRTILWRALKRGQRTEAAERIAGCPVAQLAQHIESLFGQGMSWGNYGKWELDHIQPCVRYDLSDITQVYQCFHYTNLQPLWRTDNRRKFTKAAQCL